LIFWFFCIKAKEHIDKYRERQPGKMQKRKAHIAFFTGQRATIKKRSRAKKAKILKT